MDFLFRKMKLHDVSRIYVLYFFDNLFYEIRNRLTPFDSPRLADNNFTEVGEGCRKHVG